MRNDIKEKVTPLQKDIKVIGVTGGIGSGKSTVCKILSEFGGKVLNADEISKRLMNRGERAYNAVVAHFGEGILQPDGEIDRKKLGGIVFCSKEQLNILNNLTHSAVGDEIKKLVGILKDEMLRTPINKGELRFIVLDVPIPVENGFFDLADTVWSVAANDDIRIERITERNGISEEDAEKRVNSQMSNREYMDIADVVIENERGIDALRTYVAEELAHYLNINTDE